jgi:putative addiction module CopG family antidote
MPEESSCGLFEELVMISQSFPPELEQFVAQQVAAGNYPSEQELVVSAVRVLRDVQARQRQFEDDIRVGMEQLERGEFNEYDEASLRRRFEELKQRAESRIAQNSKADQ